MQKYKIEFTTSQKHIIDVLANTEAEAVKIAEAQHDKANEQGILHYYANDSETREHTNTYDVTNTDDPFDALNDPNRYDNMEDYKNFPEEVQTIANDCGDDTNKFIHDMALAGYDVETDMHGTVLSITKVS